jgi:hypothetical protein
MILADKLGRVRSLLWRRFGTPEILSLDLQTWYWAQCDIFPFNSRAFPLSQSDSFLFFFLCQCSKNYPLTPSHELLMLVEGHGTLPAASSIEVC